MAAFNFPNSPSVNQTHTENGITFRWDGSIWKRAGIAGAQGAQGVQGTIGPQGHQGRQGAVGAQGAQGAQGHQGHQGVQGAQGHQGRQGAAGPQGHQGVQGAQGAVGAQGAQGAVGNNGGAGAQGHQGHQGHQGASGGAGAQGAQGHQGRQGAGGTATINNNSNDRVITGSNTAGELNAESDLTYDGTKLKLSDNKRFHFGNGNDLQISHTNVTVGNSGNDSNGDSILAGGDWYSYINDSDSGPLIFKTDGGPGTGAFQFYDTGWRPILKLFSGTNARTALYHGGSEKLVTDAGGISITGGIKDKDGDLGSSGQVLSSTGTQLDWVTSSNLGIPSGVIVLWSGAANAIPSGWVLCDGQNSTPNLAGRFVVGYSDSDNDYDVGDTGGNYTQTLSTNQIPAHTHGDGNYSTSNTGAHTHSDGNYSTSNTGAHSHTYSNAVTGTYNEPRNLGVGSDGGANQSGTTSNTGAHSHDVTGNSGSNGNHSHDVTGSSGSTGGGQPIDIRPPYYALCYIMKS